MREDAAHALRLRRERAEDEREADAVAPGRRRAGDVRGRGAVAVVDAQEEHGPGLDDGAAGDEVEERRLRVDDDAVAAVPPRPGRGDGGEERTAEDARPLGEPVDRVVERGAVRRPPRRVERVAVERAGLEGRQVVEQEAPPVGLVLLEAVEGRAGRPPAAARVQRRPEAGRARRELVDGEAVVEVVRRQQVQAIRRRVVREVEGAEVLGRRADDPEVLRRVAVRARVAVDAGEVVRRLGRPGARGRRVADLRRAPGVRVPAPGHVRGRGHEEVARRLARRGLVVARGRADRRGPGRHVVGRAVHERRAVVLGAARADAYRAAKVTARADISRRSPRPRDAGRRGPRRGSRRGPASRSAATRPCPGP